MKEIVDWLIEIEKISGKLYDDASRRFNDDYKLSSFLNHMAEDEGWHYHVMRSAAEYLRKEPDIKNELIVDRPIKERIESSIKSRYDMLSAGTLTKSSILDCIIDTEYSEWNHIFIYVVNTLKQGSREFMYVASKMQRHIEEVTEFIKSLPNADQYLDKIHRLPEVWKRKFLIVEDYEPIRLLFKSLLEDLGTVETVRNGKDALAKVIESYFDVIISDIDMPLMNGIDFCKEAMKKDPNIVKRIIYCSASHNEKYSKFIKDNNMKRLIKPLNIIDIRRHVREILASTN